MGLAERFVAAATQVYATVGEGAELLPTVLARACVEVLPVAGAGLSVTDRLRIPLGASDEVATRAERLQTTLGEGPCLAATASGAPQVYDLAAMAGTWPMFHHEFVAQTPYRSVASFPLRSPQHERFGALDLYSTDPDGHTLRSLLDLGPAVIGPISAILFATPTPHSEHGIGLPPWMNTDSVIRRHNVWVAVGMMTEHGNLTSTNALDLLRAYAFSHDTTLDDTADQLTHRHLQPSTVLAS